MGISGQELKLRVPLRLVSGSSLRATRRPGHSTDVFAEEADWSRELALPRGTRVVTRNSELGIPGSQAQLLSSRYWCSRGLRLTPGRPGHLESRIRVAAAEAGLAMHTASPIGHSGSHWLWFRPKNGRLHEERHWRLGR